ncbi:MAG: phage tail sheath subtilisin-like domain-containing protein [Candidatus Aminicenantes bacterium]|jgi:hypothetical protein
MARETVIPSVSVEVVKEVVPPSPAATGIVAILGATEKGPLLEPQRIDRFPTFKEIFGVGSVYSMPEAKQALQNGAKELVIVKLANGSKASADFTSTAGNNALRLSARAEGIYGNEISVMISAGKAAGTHKVEVYYQSDEAEETFDNLTMHPGDPRYLVDIINNQSELISAQDLTGILPAVMDTRRRLAAGTDGVQSSLILTGTANSVPAVNIISIQAVEFGVAGDSIEITVEADPTVGYNITISDGTTTESYEDVELDPAAHADSARNYILDELNTSSLITSALHADYTTFTAGDTLDTPVTNEPLAGGTDRIPAALDPPLQDAVGAGSNDLISVIARDPGDGTAGERYYVRVMAGSSDDTVTFNVWNDGTAPADPPDESYADVNINRDSPDYIIDRVNAASTRIQLEYLAAAETLAVTTALQPLTGGTNPEVGDFETGLSRLEKEADVDIVVPSIQYPPRASFTTAVFNESQNIFAAVDAHCKLMSDAACNRIGFGGVSREESLTQSSERTNTIGSDRFVITAPYGVVGAVAGLVGQLTYYYSPTFKALTGFTTLERDFSPTDLRTLLRANIVPLDAKKGKGIIIIRGLTTDGDQISVRRVADYAVRNIKNIAERFIGNLNTQGGRDALKQKVFEFLRQMEKDSAIVPSTDGTDPAFKVDVYSTQRDFALGIVRLDIAVRPVRAMDFIYATILVQV